jgi:gas vesicle protein
MNKFMGFLAGAFCGALIGSVTALLFAPMSGKELQAQAKDRFDNMIEETRYAAQAKQAELQAKLSDLTASRQPANANAGNSTYGH